MTSWWRAAARCCPEAKARRTSVVAVAGRASRSFYVTWGWVPHVLRRWIVRLVAPSFTVGAACVIERDDGAILLVRLVYRRGWGLPGGLIKRREDVADCARREVYEEVGLRVELTSAAAVVVDGRPQRVDVVFRAVPADGSDPADAHARSSELVEARWYPADELPRLQHEAVSALLALAGRERDGAAGAAGRDGSDTLRRAAACAAGQR
jgi:8-oxo-dGTP pyrophosphatase MutT (NUDIX family)